MTFYLDKAIESISSDLKISYSFGKKILTGDLGYRLITELQIPCSPVELSMYLKSLRKRLSFKFRRSFNQQTSVRVKRRLFKNLLNYYNQFYKVHQAYYNNEIGQKKLIQFFNKDFILPDSGITKNRFFTLTPHILRKLPPELLDALYIASTKLRFLVAKYLQSRIDNELLLRGSVIFISCRPFGCGLSANFPEELDQSRTKSTYRYNQGSDLDLKIKRKRGKDKEKIKANLEKSIIQIQKEFLNKLQSFLTIELTCIDNLSDDDLLSVSKDDWWVDLLNLSLKGKVFDQLEDFLKSVRSKTEHVVFSRKIKKNKIRLTNQVIMDLKDVLIKVFVFYKCSDDFITKYSKKWYSCLMKLKRETDNEGLIAISLLERTFNNLFFLSGDRLDIDEKQKLFKLVLTKYEKN